MGVVMHDPDDSPSRPTRGAWIEISCDWNRGFFGRRRAPQGARGLKYVFRHYGYSFREVAPHKGRVD